MALTPSAGRRWRLGATTVAAVTTIAFGLPAQAAPVEGQILNVGGSTAVTDSYIVVLKDGGLTADKVDSAAQTLAGRHGGRVARTYQHALRGFEAHLTESAARRLAADPSVQYVQQNHTVSIDGTQTPTPSWGLDRIDQRPLPLNNSFAYPNQGWDVRAYIIDTGIRFSHSDFGGRASSGFDAIDGGSADDGQGHGTHVAATVGGSTYGVAKSVKLIGVRVLDNTGNGTYAQVIAGIDWVTGDHDPGEPAVANMSLGGDFFQSLNDAVSASIADGVTFVVSAGNEYGSNACAKSPASTPDAITVGATTSNDSRANYSNVGSCLDIFAPGSLITSAWNSSDSATATISGTSMASPHVTGTAALILSKNPTYTPAQVRNKLVNDATSNAVVDAGYESPNKLLYVGDAGVRGPLLPPGKRRPIDVTP
ncbi:S8 family peptidase [Micromonospora sp. NPDC003197]